MAADKLTPAMIKDVTPNLGVKTYVFTATSDDTADYVDMADYGFSSIYMAMAVDVSANAAVVCEVDSTTHVKLTGTTGETTVFVVGV